MDSTKTQKRGITNTENLPKELFSINFIAVRMVKLSLLTALLAFVLTVLVHCKVKVGVDVLKSNGYQAIDGCSLAVLANPTSLLQDFTHVVDDLAKTRPQEMKVILGPEHGFRGNLQAETGRDESSFFVVGGKSNWYYHLGDPPFYIDDYTGLPVISAYSLSTDQLVEYFREYRITCVLVDMQDVGVRLYTFIWTMYKVMTAFATYGKEDNFQPKLIVADRPNPNGGVLVDGPMLNMSFASGYARVPIPFIHGMTIAELSLYFNTFIEPRFENIEVIKMENWRRSMLFYETGLNWVPPSPNLPTIFSAIVYGATVFIEGTTVSEGRGTCTPFTIFGAPFYSAHTIANYFNTLFGCSSHLPCFRAAYYQPTFQKYNNTMIEGIHYVERPEWIERSEFVLRNFTSAVAVLKALKDLSEEEGAFQWDGSWFGHPGTELVDQYAGTDQLHLMIDAGSSVKEIVDYFTPEREQFNQNIRQKYLLYV